MPMDLRTTKETARDWGITPGRVRQLAQAGRIAGAYKMGRDWLIPYNTIITRDRRQTKDDHPIAADPVD